MKVYQLFCGLALLLSLVGSGHSNTCASGCDENDNLFSIAPLVDYEFRGAAPLVFFFRLGKDFTFRRYGDYLSLDGLNMLPMMAFSSMVYWMISKKAASALSRWTDNRFVIHTAHVLSMAILPELKRALYSWYTGTRLGGRANSGGSPLYSQAFLPGAGLSS